MFRHPVRREDLWILCGRFNKTFTPIALAEYRRERPLFIHIRVAHSDALGTVINMGPDEN